MIGKKAAPVVLAPAEHQKESFSGSKDLLPRSLLYVPSLRRKPFRLPHAITR